MRSPFFSYQVDLIFSPHFSGRRPREAPCRPEGQEKTSMVSKRGIPTAQEQTPDIWTRDPQGSSESEKAETLCGQSTISNVIRCMLWLPTSYQANRTRRSSNWETGILKNQNLSSQSLLKGQIIAARCLWRMRTARWKMEKKTRRSKTR
jgi:hypothetical protein